MIRRLQPTVDVDRICLDSDELDKAVERAGREARLRHKQAGVPLVVWRDGQIVEIPPEEIVVDLPQAGSPPANPS
jgi:hypothetical protein